MRHPLLLGGLSHALLHLIRHHFRHLVKNDVDAAVAGSMLLAAVRKGTSKSL
jgi:hypothetical protein